jgi:hypothetical protein
LFIPSVLGIVVRDNGQTPAIVVGTILVGWVLWCLRGPWLRPKRPLSQGVAGLLAGIVLVDWLAAVSLTFSGITFIGLFFLALLLQRVAPAT